MEGVSNMQATGVSYLLFALKRDKLAYWKQTDPSINNLLKPDLVI